MENMSANIVKTLDALRAFATANGWAIYPNGISTTCGNYQIYPSIAYPDTVELWRRYEVGEEERVALLSMEEVWEDFQTA